MKIVCKQTIKIALFMMSTTERIIQERVRAHKERKKFKSASDRFWQNPLPQSKIKRDALSSSVCIKFAQFVCSLCRAVSLFSIWKNSRSNLGSQLVLCASARFSSVYSASVQVDELINAQAYNLSHKLYNFNITKMPIAATVSSTKKNLWLL